MEAIASGIIDLTPLMQRVDAMTARIDALSARLAPALYSRGFLDGVLCAGIGLIVLYLLLSPRPSK